MKLRLLLWALFAAALAVPVGTSAAADRAPAPSALQVPMRVMSYNIHTGIGEDSRLDLARTAATIRDSGAEVVGIQEADVHWAARSAWADQVGDLAAALGMRSCFAPIYSFSPPPGSEQRREYGVAVLSRHPIVSCENHDLARLSTQDPNPAPAPGPGLPEAVVETTGARVHVYVTHLDFRADPSVRRQQVADTLRILDEDEPGAQQLLLGDFNAEPQASELQPLWHRMTDAWAVVHGPAGGLTYPAITPVKRIDYVTASRGIAVSSATVVESTASDHRPVVADLVVRRGNRSAS
jgi:endonuclease/exonuclease/phosphatase family metal-dependent hydrolase